MAGHLYGASEKHNSSLPAESILANIDLINQTNSKLFVLLGDNFRETTPLHVLNFKKNFALKTTIPIFNSVGNHDVTDRTLYEQNFGKTYFDFTYNQELFVFLDTESEGNSKGHISGKQLSWFKNLLAGSSENKRICNIFIFSHKLIWAIDNPAYTAVFSHLNNKYGYPGTGYNFKQEIKPRLIELSQQGKSIYWISGDIGTSGSYTLFYEKDPDYEITYLATGIGDTANDVIVKVEIQENRGNRKVQIIPISLTNQKMQSIEYYDNNYWKDYFHAKKEQKSNLKKLKYFSIGLLTGLCLFFITSYVLKK
ncbi:MAG: metallophosphoesterase [Candidatus Omnitrophica bacterium]|nr:metallophosphoesterase [Candidatus Omnitrophota bacterium]